jgi:HSP20 family protein
MVEKTTPFAGWWPDLYQPLRTARERIADWFAPASEASSNDDAYRVVVELPGVAESDVEVTVNDRVLLIKGEKKSEREEKGESFYFSERTYGAFQRSFRLPEDADVERIAAGMKDGVLTVTVPKLREQPSAAKKIAVKRA